MAQPTERITTQASELGKLIAASPAGKALQAARRDLEADEQARKLFQDYQQQLEKIAQLERLGKPIEPEDKRTLADLQQKVASDSTLKLWMKTQADFSELMRKVNQALIEPFHDASTGEQS